MVVVLPWHYSSKSIIGLIGLFSTITLYRTKNLLFYNVSSKSRGTRYGFYDYDHNVLESFRDLVLMPPELIVYDKYFECPRIYPDLKLVFCPIRKNCNSQFKGLFCMAQTSDPKLAHKIATVPNSVHSQPGCYGTKFNFTRKRDLEKEAILTSSSWNKLLVLRDPFDRFVSGFIDRCIRKNESCFDCRRDVHCFAQKLLRQFTELTAPGLSHVGKIRMITHGCVNHLLPQHWNWDCGLESHLKDYQVMLYDKSEDFNQYARELLESLRVDPAMLFSGWGEDRSDPFLSVSTKHAANETEFTNVSMQTRSNLATVDAIFQIYYTDYYHFHFKLPDWLFCLCKLEPDSRYFDVCTFTKLLNERVFGC